MNPICELLDIEYPILQGAMARIADAQLAAAVSNGGGLGVIASGGETKEWLEKEIDKVRTMTDKPFGVNLMLLSPNIDELIEVICDKKVPVVTTGAGNPGKYIPQLKDQGVIVIPVLFVIFQKLQERIVPMKFDLYEEQMKIRENEQ